MKTNLLILFILTSLLLLGCTTGENASEKTLTGLDQVNEFQHFFQGKRIGIITNHTAYNSKGEHISDIFLAMPDVQVTAFFGPEHGIRGKADAGEKIDDQTDPISDIPIYSLYGKTRKPNEEMLANVDVLVFDIQDVGARFYTYIYTMAYGMQAAAEQGKQFVVLDRPNPISGNKVEGNILLPEFATFVGLYPIPVVHGMTVGELATMFNKENWLGDQLQADLTIIPMKNWQRSQWYDESGLKFIKPSPNIPDLTSAIVYPGICLLEGTNLSEGRGTSQPFQIFGAPWIDGDAFTSALNELRLPGVTFNDTIFTPVSIPGASKYPKHQDKRCEGAFIQVDDRESFSPYLTGIHIVNTVHQMYPDSLKWHIKHFDRLCGSNVIREGIISGGSVNALVNDWQASLVTFLGIREKYLLY